MPGLVGLGEDVVPQRELVRNEFHSQFGRDMTISAVSRRSSPPAPRSIAAIGIARSSKRLFCQDDVRLMRTLMPHLQRAWHLHTRLTEAEGSQQSLAEALDRLVLGVMLVGAGGRLAFANDAARALLAASDGLVLDSGVLRGAGSAGYGRAALPHRRRAQNRDGERPGRRRCPASSGARPVTGPFVSSCPRFP